MFSSRFVPTIFSAVIFGIVLAGCGAATEQPPAQPPASEAAAPTNTPAPAVVEEPATPTLAPTTQEPTAAAPAAPAATEEAASAAPTEPEAAEASASLRTFQIVPEQSKRLTRCRRSFLTGRLISVNPIGRTQAIEGEFQLTISGNQVQLADNQFIVDLRTPWPATRRAAIIESATSGWSRISIPGLSSKPPPSRIFRRMRPRARMSLSRLREI